MIRKIAVTGPESTGKSWLAEQLAQVYQTVWVPEFARTFLTQLGRPYEEADILTIAKNQIQREKELEAKANNLLFCDTELLVTKIWSEVKYNRCDPWIIQTMETHPYNLYLLCNIDIPWESDPQREHPHLREYLFTLYYREMRKRNWTFHIVSGLGDQRLHQAIKFIENWL